MGVMLKVTPPQTVVLKGNAATIGFIVMVTVNEGLTPQVVVVGVTT